MNDANKTVLNVSNAYKILIKVIYLKKKKTIFVILMISNSINNSQIYLKTNEEIIIYLRNFNNRKHNLIINLY